MKSKGKPLSYSTPEEWLGCNCPSSLLSQHLTLQPCASKEEGSDEIIRLLLAQCLARKSGIALHVPSAVASAHYAMLTGISAVTYTHLKGTGRGE